MRISIIAAMDLDGWIGRDGDLPWHLPVDLKHFKRTTRGKPLIMGRKTWDTLDGPLPNRKNIVLTRSSTLEAEGAFIAHTIDEALAAAGDAEEVMIGGGAFIYELFLSRADRVHLTTVQAHVGGDTRFPPFERGEWYVVEREEHAADEKNAYACVIETLERVR